MIKKLICLAMMLSLAAIAFSQITVVRTKTFLTKPDQQVDLNLKFASAIEVTSTDAKELTIEMIYKMDRAELEKIHQIEVEESNEKIVLETDYDVSSFPEEEQYRYKCWSCENNNPHNPCVCFNVSYRLAIPKGMYLKLGTISGDIELNGFEGPIKAKSVSGFIDLSWKPNRSSDFAFRTVTGEIYSDFDIELDKSSTSYNKKLTTSLNGGGNLVALESVSGDIFFRQAAK